MKKLIVSACLAGIKCKYDGTYNTVAEIKEMVEKGLAIPVCPEVLGGAPVPREANEITAGDGFGVWAGKAKVVTKHGVDNTGVFMTGAQKVLDIAIKNNIQLAILKERSPSCGSSFIYDGSFSGKKLPGQGVTGALLKRAGLIVCSEENYLEFLKKYGYK